jgi:hypothetical protein
VSYVIKLIGTVRAMWTPHDGKYLKTYLPAPLNEDGSWGLGCLDTTERIEEALKFVTLTDAMTAYRAQSGIRPYDGKPNRPLTAWTVEFEPLP